MTPNDEAALVSAFADLAGYPIEDRSVAYLTMRRWIEEDASRERVFVAYMLCAVLLTCGDGSPNYTQAVAVIKGMHEHVPRRELERVSTEIVMAAASTKTQSLHALAKIVYVAAHEDQRG